MLFAYFLVSIYKIILLIMKKNIYWFAISNVIDYIIIAVLLLTIYLKLGGQKFSISLKKGRYLINRSKYYIISGLMIVIFTQTDKVMLKIMLNDSAIGYYSAAVTCAGLSSFVFSAIIDSARPSIFEGAKISVEKFRINMIRLYSIVIYMSLAQSVIMTFFASPIVEILYGQQYVATAGVLKLVVWYTTFSYLGYVRGIWMLVEEKQKYLLIINVSGAIANVILNFSLIPYLGMNGAAISSIITQFFSNVVIGFLIKDIRPNNKLMVKALSPKYAIDIAKMLIKR